MEEIVLSKDDETAIKKLLAYSWRDIGYNYSGLTDLEREAVAPAEFDRLVKWIGKAPRLQDEATRLRELLADAHTMINDLTHGWPQKELHRTPESLLTAITECLREKDL